MLIDDVILFVLFSWVIPLSLFVYFQVTTAKHGTKHARRRLKWREIAPVMRILVAQKLALILVVAFIALVRFIGDFPGREWVAFGLYTLLVGLAWVVLIYQRRVQRPQERRIRNL
ncbi:hypothetical protein [Microbacterium sp. NPDC087592]|uniref:putative phage holin n=1 Tax=Microbacterium sp. NPDC087592 TaxID=3364193 RepID=UPI00381A1783